MSQAKKFGTFGGVFTPSILTILGVIMYMRLGWVVGGAGSLGTVLLIILMAHVVSLSTGLSVSSVATDKKIKAGGIYYMLSRSLGLPIGGAIGITLFIATALSIALYLIGFAESALAVLQEPLAIESININHLRIFGSLALFLIVTIAFISTSIAIKSQYFILGAIVLSLVSIFFGTAEGKEFNLSEIENSEINFSVLFGVFFPAVTGFTAGVAMSGDLKDPKKSIPWGTMLAIFTGLAVYVTLAVFIFYSIDQEILLSDKNALIVFGLIPSLVVVGIWGATLSSALGGILGAPRILQAMSVDKITPKIFGKGVGVDNEPRNALILTFVIAELGILIGELDVIAEVVAMFYMTAYLFINLSCFLEQWASPDFLPKFKIPLLVPLVGAIATFLLMIQLNLVASIVAILFMTIVFLFLARRQLNLGSGDVWQNVWYGIVKLGLKNVLNKKTHKRNWEPNLLTFFEGENKEEFLNFSQSFTGKLSFISQFNYSPNEAKGSRDSLIVENENTRSKGIFERKFTDENYYEGITAIAKYYGFSGVEPNTAVFDYRRFNEDPDNAAFLIDKLVEIDYNLVFLNFSDKKGFGNKKVIDVYWSDLSSVAEFSLSLLRFFYQSSDWRNVEVRVFYSSFQPHRSRLLKSKIEEIINDYRIQAQVKIINKSINSTLVDEYSFDSDLVVVGWDIYNENFKKSESELPTMLLLKPSSYFESITIDEEEAFNETYEKDKEVITELSFNIGNEVLPNLRLAFLNAKNPFVNQVVKFNQEEINTLQDVLDLVNNHLNKLSDIDVNHHDFEILLKENYLNFIADYKEILNKRENSLDIEKEIELKLNLVKRTIESLPSKLTRFVNEDELKKDKKDSWGVKSAKAYLRLKKSILGKTKIKINYRDLVSYRYEHNYLPSFKNSLKIINAISYNYWSKHQQILEDLIIINADDFYFQYQKNLKIIQATVGNSIENEAYLKQKLNSLEAPLNEFLLQLDEDMERLNINSLIEEKLEAKQNRKIVAVLNDINTYNSVFNTNNNRLLEELKVKSKILELAPLLDHFYQQLISKVYLKDLKQILNKANDEQGIKTLNKELNINTIKYSFQDFFNEYRLITDDIISELPSKINAFNNEQKKQYAHHALFSDRTISLRLESILNDVFNTFYKNTQEELFRLENGVNQNLLEIKSRFNILDNDGLVEEENQLSEEKLIIQNKENIQNIENRIRQFETIIRDKIAELAETILKDFTKYDTSTKVLGKSRKDNKLSKLTSSIKNRSNQFYDKKIQPIIDKGVSLAVKNETIKNESLNTQSEVQRFVSDYLINENLRNKLPTEYIKLLKSGSPKLTIKTRKEDIQYGLKLLGLIKEKGGVMLITGDYLVGRKSFSNYLLNESKETSTKIEITPSLSELNIKESLVNQLQLKLDSIDVEHSFETQERKTFLFNHIEALILDKEAQNYLLNLVEKFSEKHFFIFNCNSLTYQYFRDSFFLNEYIIGTVALGPMDRVNFVEALSEKQKASGYKVKLVGDDNIVKNKSAQFIYKSFYQAAKGNIGFASLLWLNSIKGFKQNTVYIKVPNYVFPEIDNHDWLAVLKVLVLYGQCSQNKLKEFFGSYIDIKKILKQLRQTNLVLFKDGVYKIKDELIHYIINSLKENQLIG